jgi:hypothetical protein
MNRAYANKQKAPSAKRLGLFVELPEAGIKMRVLIKHCKMLIHIDFHKNKNLHA